MVQAKLIIPAEYMPALARLIANNVPHEIKHDLEMRSL
jgi:hypothetical protein